jgi:hypothetical protein
MGCWRILDIVLGMGGISYGLLELFLKEYPPLGGQPNCFGANQQPIVAIHRQSV